MALLRYLKPSSKQSSSVLPDADGPLSLSIPSPVIREVNKVLEATQSCFAVSKRVHIPVIITRIFWSKIWLAENKSIRNFFPPIIALFAENLFFENNPLYGIRIFPIFIYIYI